MQGATAKCSRVNFKARPNIQTLDLPMNTGAATVDWICRFRVRKGGNGVRGLDMIVERFIVFAQDASNQMPLLVGNSFEVVLREEGDEVIVHWYSPASVLASGRRS